MPLLRRARAKYRRPRFPRGAEWIVLVDANGAEDGPYRVADFAPLPDGTWVCQTLSGHARFLRVVEQSRDGWVTSLDGGGRPWRYRMVAVPADEVSGAG